jgi:carboxymethylenebutenolidase
MIEQQIDVPTADGRMTTFTCHPERDGPFPVILLYMDAPGIREELRDMARRLGTSGYYVMLPNLYYRSGLMELSELALAEDERRKRMFELMESLSISKIMQDTDSLLAFAKTQGAANTHLIGAVGYCMSGQFAISAAARFPDQVKAAASIYGVRLVTDAPDSPHLAAARVKGELYVGCAETDHWAPPEMVEALTKALADLPIEAEVEIYPGVDHGFAFPQRAVYDKAAAERHWERLLALFGRRLAA